MYAICYRFTLIEPSPEAEAEFTRLWSGVTEYFKHHCGALGSRLHHTGKGEFFGYAQWPSLAVHEAAGDHEVGQDFVRMRVRWSEIANPTEVVFAGEVAADLFAA